eukprot:9254234-Pyramimonas_sp.AAC.1
MRRTRVAVRSATSTTTIKNKSVKWVNRRIVPNKEPMRCSLSATSEITLMYNVHNNGAANRDKPMRLRP